MKARAVLCLVYAVAALYSMPASAQTTSTVYLNAPQAAASPWGRSYLGINVGRARNGIACGGSSMLCDDRDRPAQLYAGTTIGSFWSAEVGVFNSGRVPVGGTEGRSQGLNLNLVGKTRVGSSLGIFGKVGTTYSRTESSLLGAGGSDQGFGLAFGGGVSWDFTPRLSARLELDSHDYRFAGGRDPVRQTSLGLQYRY